MRKVKVALIGFNDHSHARQICQSLKEQTDIFELVGYTLPENEREKFPYLMHFLEGYPEMTLEEILNNPEIEAVAVETEEIYLTKYATLAAEHGKHIHMEKPGGQSLEEFEKLIDTVKKNKVVFSVGYMYRYNPYVAKILKEVEDGEFGEIINVEAQMNCYHDEETRQWLSHMKGGMTFFLGCHLIDLIYRIQGQPNKIIPMNKCTGVDGVTSEDFGMVVFEYDNGVSFAKASAYEIGGYARRQLVVVGTKKTVVLEPFEMTREGGRPGYNMYTGKVECKVPRPWEDRGEYSESEEYNRYDPMLSAFASFVRGERENPFTPDYELELYKVLRKSCGGECDV